jgi:hypothetical protein
VVFWLPYKIINHYKCINYQKATEEDDRLDNWQMSNLEIIKEYQKKK